MNARRNLSSAVPPHMPQDSGSEFILRVELRWDIWLEEGIPLEPKGRYSISVLMRLVFWLSLSVVAYTYLGYAILLGLLARLRRLPVDKKTWFPDVSIVIAAHNEEARLPAKLSNLFALDYPAHKLQIVVASDGSTDGTDNILLEHRNRVTPVFLPAAGGKANALNHAVQAATGEILVFLDVRQSVDPDAISELVSCFADPQVGAVSGELHLETAEGRPSPDALGVYWKIEKIVRKLESATGSVVGATGAIYAMRRELFLPLPAGTLLDDVLAPMQVARTGKRVIFHDRAIARDRIFDERGKEFGRKVRTLTGNYQMLRLAPWLLGPSNPLLFRLVSHKLLRLAVPFALVLMLLSSALAPFPLYHLAFGLQLFFYALAVLGALAPACRRWRPVSIAFTFAMLNAAAAFALYNFIGGRARWA